MENIRALGETALEENAYGMMLTTWHTLPMKIGALQYAGSVMWSGADAGKEVPQYLCAEGKTAAATFLRNIRKGPVFYADAGWFSFEVQEFFDS